MKENLTYLFITGLILGSGPCLSLCAPILIGYTAAHKATLKESIFSYLVFSISKLISYIILGVLCAAGVKILNSPFFIEYLDFTYFGLGAFIILIGISTIFYKVKSTTKICEWLHRGNVRNMGILGILIGFTPCLPLWGILNYVVIISHTAFDAVIYSFVFGLGTTLSPLLLLVMLSAKAANKLSQNSKFKLAIRIICGTTLLFLGGKIILQKLLQ